MTFQRDFLTSLVSQGFGSAAVFATVVMIGAVLGPELQGSFSRIKTEIEFVATLALIGLPQSVFFYLSSGRLTLRSALAITLVVALVALILSIGYRFANGIDTVAYSIVFALASVFFTAHSMLRVILLARASVITFAFATATPQVLLFLFSCVAILFGALPTIASTSMLGAAFLIGSAFTLWKICITPSVAIAHWLGNVGAAEICRYSLAGGAAGILAAGASLLMIKAVERSFGSTALGVMTMGLLLAQIVATPCNYAAPLLFKQLMGSAPNRAWMIAPLMWGGLAFAATAAGLQTLQLLASPDRLQGYGALFELKWPLALTVAADVALRISSPSVLALGQPWLLLCAEIGRIGLLAGGLAAGIVVSVLHAIWLWCAASMFAALILLLLIASKVRS